MDIKKQALDKHFEWKGKIEVVSRTEVKNSQQLSTAYTPGGGGTVPGDSSRRKQVV